MAGLIILTFVCKYLEYKATKCTTDKRCHGASLPTLHSTMLLAAVLLLRLTAVRAQEFATMQVKKNLSSFSPV